VVKLEKVKKQKLKIKLNNKSSEEKLRKKENSS
jgi:hypothetical protein